MPHYFTNAPRSYDFAYVTTVQTYPMEFEQRHPWRKVSVPDDRVSDMEHCKHLYAWYAIVAQGSPEATSWLRSFRIGFERLEST